MTTQKQTVFYSLHFSGKLGNLKHLTSKPWLLKLFGSFCSLGNLWESSGKLRETYSLMRRRSVILCFFVLVTGFCKGQVNLVPNFSFEQYSTCPTAQDQVQYATGWDKCSNLGSTPDYYNACSSSSLMGVPQGYFFYQQAHRNCGAYMGLVTRTNNPNDREDIGIQLSSPLIIGQKYYLSFYTVMGGSYDGTFYYESPSNNIGMRLSTIAYTSSNPAPIDNFAHLRSVSIINDTANWVRITGSIIADSSYNYLMLGNFYDDTNTDTTTLNCGACVNLYSYCLVDDVCLSTDSLLCNGGIDVLLCTVSVPEIMLNNEIIFFPNPVTDILNVSFQDNSLSEINLTDVFGEIVYSERIEGKTSVNINISSFPSGLYFLKIINKKNEKTISKKIVKL
jgi:hypothetical protein